jgi:hypothetical protein
MCRPMVDCDPCLRHRKFDVAAEVPDDHARQPDGILPLHAHATAARLIENVDPHLTENVRPHDNE